MSIQAIRVVLIDGLHFRDHVIFLALGIAADGHKHVLALREGTTENATVFKYSRRHPLRTFAKTFLVRLFGTSLAPSTRPMDPPGTETSLPRTASPCSVRDPRTPLPSVPARCPSTSYGYRTAWRNVACQRLESDVPH